MHVKEIDVEFVSENGLHYLTTSTGLVEVQYTSRRTPEQFGQMLTLEIKELLDNEEDALEVIRIGDNLFILSTFQHEASGQYTVSLAELRNDGIGMHLENPIPRVIANAALPIVTARQAGSEVGMHVHQYSNGLSSVGQLMFDAFIASLQLPD